MILFAVSNPPAPLRLPATTVPVRTQATVFVVQSKDQPVLGLAKRSPPTRSSCNSRTPEPRFLRPLGPREFREDAGKRRKTTRNGGNRWLLCRAGGPRVMAGDRDPTGGTHNPLVAGSTTPRKDEDHEVFGLSAVHLLVRSVGPCPRRIKRHAVGSAIRRWAAWKCRFRPPKTRKRLSGTRHGERHCSLESTTEADVRVPLGAGVSDPPGGRHVDIWYQSPLRHRSGNGCEGDAARSICRRTLAVVDEPAEVDDASLIGSGDLGGRHSLGCCRPQKLVVAGE